MEFPTELHTMQSPAVERTQVINSQTVIAFLSLKINFALVNSTDPDGMTHDAAFHLCLHCLPKYPFMHFRSLKGYRNNLSTSYLILLFF